MIDEKRNKNGNEPVLMPNEAGDIGDEQLPAGTNKTDKVEWDYAADKAKKGPRLPDGVREFLNGL